MSQISVNHLTFSYEESFDLIFEDVSFTIDTDWKLGFVGRNGKGKTTFFRLLLGEYSYEGSIHTSMTFAYFPYTVTLAQMKLPAADFMEELKPQCELWRVICELEQLQESAEILYRPFLSLSPGERTKILLAVLFSGDNDFLLIDEPTNHLDQRAREQVKQYLSGKKGYILVSHDRDLLDACVNHMLVLNRQTIEVQSGNFSSWWENKQKKDLFAKAENEKHRREIGKLKQAAERTSEWARKNESTKIGFDPTKEHDRFISTRSYIGAKTKKMQSRVKQMEKRIHRKMEEKEGLLVDIEEPVNLKIMPLVYHRERLVDIRKYSVKYPDAGAPVFSEVSFSIRRGQRIALQGQNGCGKTTLLKMIMQKAGALDVNVTAEEKGDCETGAGLVISYVNQETNWLRGSVREFCQKKHLEEALFCAVLCQLGMERRQFTKNLEDYSQGQKKKVLLAASLMTPAHLYIWDEPLNYMDVFSRIQLENLLLRYQPTMLFVEHDTQFCEKIATEMIKL